MSVYNTIEKMIRRFGDDICIMEDALRNRSKAIIQPLMYKNKMYLGGTALPAGFFDGGHYLMIAPASLKVKDYRRAVVEDANAKYTIKRVEMVKADNKELYIWAVLTPYYPPVEDDYEELDKCA
ncbi:MAG: hypothetical protein IJA62_06045 [Ruminococcus sp.]|nr:hypothetical protein [Ruminococcus sp.]